MVILSRINNQIQDVSTDMKQKLWKRISYRNFKINNSFTIIFIELLKILTWKNKSLFQYHTEFIRIVQISTNLVQFFSTGHGMNKHCVITEKLERTAIDVNARIYLAGCSRTRTSTLHVPHWTDRLAQNWISDSVEHAWQLLRQTDPLLLSLVIIS